MLRGRPRRATPSQYQPRLDPQSTASLSSKEAASTTSASVALRLPSSRPSHSPPTGPPPRARGASSLCHCRSEDIPRGSHEPSGTHAAFMEAPSLIDGGWWSPQVEPRRRRLGGWQPMTVVPPHSCKRIPGLPTEKYNFTMPLDVAYKYPEDTTVDEEVYINSHLLLNFLPSLFCFIWCWPWPPLNLWHTLGLLRANS